MKEEMFQWVSRHQNMYMCSYYSFHCTAFFNLLTIFVAAKICWFFLLEHYIL